jgi:hypothetical protein
MDKKGFTITIFCDSKTQSWDYHRKSEQEKIPRHRIREFLIMRKKNVLDWLEAMLSMVFYIGVFGGIGYLLQALIL